MDSIFRNDRSINVRTLGALEFVTLPSLQCNRTGVGLNFTWRMSEAEKRLRRRWIPRCVGRAMLTVPAQSFPAITADGEIKIAGIPDPPFAGPSLHNASARPLSNHTPYVSGQVSCGGILVIQGQNADGHWIKNSIVDPVGKLKSPHTQGSWIA